jgi:hypothetical protein
MMVYCNMLLLLYMSHLVFSLIAQPSETRALFSPSDVEGGKGPWSVGPNWNK